MGINQYIESFERFWQLYPRKAAKQEALAEWIKLKPDEQTVEKILEAVRLQVLGKVLKKDDKFTPHPRRWLHGGRWEDVINTDAQRLAEARKKRIAEQEQAELKASEQKQRAISKLISSTAERMNMTDGQDL